MNWKGLGIEVAFWVVLCGLIWPLDLWRYFSVVVVISAYAAWQIVRDE